MFIQDLRQDFYNRLIGKRILIIVNYDIDAICASKILQALFKYDHMLYSVVPIMGLAGLQRAYAEHQGDVKFVLLLNCGGCVDIVELLQPEEDVTFFICDAHRPLDVCNIYSDRQVRNANCCSLYCCCNTIEIKKHMSFVRGPGLIAKNVTSRKWHFSFPHENSIQLHFSF